MQKSLLKKKSFVYNQVDNRLIYGSCSNVYTDVCVCVDLFQFLHFIPKIKINLVIQRELVHYKIWILIERIKWEILYSPKQTNKHTHTHTDI